VTGFRDELRRLISLVRILQLHLLSMQARERAEDFGANVESLEERLDRGIEHAVQTATTKTRN
jgi:hypothetical protein